MSFALPLALLVGLLAAGPIIAHVVRRSETPPRALPTFRLLERALADSQKRRRLDDRTLFALRILLILLATLAAAAPFIRVPLELGDGRACSLAIVIDGSRSMLARSGSRPLVEIARERAARAAKELPEGSEVTVVLASDPPRVLLDRSADLEAAARAAREIDPQAAIGGDRLAPSVRLALRRLHGSSFAVRRLLVYSDFAQHVDLAGMETPSGVSADYVRLEPDGRENATVVVDAVRVDEEDESARVVRAGVVAEGLAAETTLELTIDGRAAASAPATISSPPSFVELRASGLRQAAPTATLIADVDDALPEDDQLDFLLRAQAATRILFVDGEPAANRYEDEVGLASRALELVPATEHRFEARRIDAGAFGEEELVRNDVIVLANIDRLSPGMASALAARVQAGLGLLVAPGDRSDGRALSQQLASVLPARIGLHAPCSERRGASARDLPRGIVVGGFAGTVHRRCTELEPNLARSRTAMVRDDGTALMVVGEVGRGRVAVLGSSLDPEDSDLPLKAGFLPLLSSLVTYLDVSGSTVEDRVLAGSSVTLGRSGLRVFGPDGRERTPDAEGRVGPLDQLGPYVVERDGQPDPDASFTVVAPVAESDLRRGPLPEVSGAEDANQAALGGTLRRDISMPLFALLGLALLAEGFLRDRQRGLRTASTTRSMPP